MIQSIHELPTAHTLWLQRFFFSHLVTERKTKQTLWTKLEIYRSWRHNNVRPCGVWTLLWIQILLQFFFFFWYSHSKNPSPQSTPSSFSSYRCLSATFGSAPVPTFLICDKATCRSPPTPSPVSNLPRYITSQITLCRFVLRALTFAKIAEVRLVCHLHRFPNSPCLAEVM